MVPAVFDTVAIEMSVGPLDAGHRMRANGSVLVEPGFIAVYQEGKDDAKDDDGDRLLPEIDEGDTIKLDLLRPEQHFTEPPPRFTEASLVKTLEEYGIGRPSTYASIIATLKNREYVEMDGKRFFPTDISRIVIGFLTEHFPQYVDYDFTANLEDDLDLVSLGEKDWVPLLEKFWRPFHKLCEEKEASVTREQVAQARELGTDPKSGKPVTVRMGRYGPFVQRPHGALWTLRTDRHQGRRRKTQIRGLTQGPKDGRDRPRYCHGALQIAAYARRNRRRLTGRCQCWPIWALHPLRR
jgi:DNA topoisomerase-1